MSAMALTREDKIRKVLAKVPVASVPELESFAETPTGKDAANGYAGLNAVSRITKGADTTDDLIIDDALKGVVRKDPDGHYWRESISILGVLTQTDLGTTKP
jgi:hypothetical protein